MAVSPETLLAGLGVVATPLEGVELDGRWVMGFDDPWDQALGAGGFLETMASQHLEQGSSILAMESMVHPARAWLSFPLSVPGETDRCTVPPCDGVRVTRGLRRSAQVAPRSPSKHHGVVWVSRRCALVVA